MFLKPSKFGKTWLNWAARRVKAKSACSKVADIFSSIFFNLIEDF